MDQQPPKNSLHILNKIHGKKKYAHYQVLEKIGEGGMGAVYKVYDTTLNRELALKVLLHKGVHFKKRFVREAKTTACLNHPNIVKFYNFFVEDESLCIVMQYIPGIQLQQYIQQKNPSLEQKLEIMVMIIEAVHYAHSYNILHRDIKPENIIVSDTGIPYLTDFGIAKINDNDEKSLTKTGSFMGTPNYVSPEQAQGQLRELDARTDVYSLGATLYEVVTGVTLFPPMKISKIIYTVLNKKPLPPSKINNKLPKIMDSICLKAVAKDKKKRYSTANDMAKDLRWFLKGKSFFLKHHIHKLWQITVLLLFVCVFAVFYSKANKAENVQVNKTIERVFFSNITKMIADEKYKKAEKLLNNIFSISKKKQNEHETYYLDMLSLYMAICLIEQRQGKKVDKEILAFLEKAKKGLPKEPKVYEYLGRYYMEKGDLVNALHNLQKSARLQPYNSNIHYYMGKILSLQNKNDLAQKSYLRALELNTLNFKAFASLYKEAVKYPHLQHFAHYHAIVVNYALARFPAPDIFQNVRDEINREHYVSYFYWRNGLFDKITSQIEDIYYYRFANLQDLYIQKQLQNAVEGTTETIEKISLTTVKKIFFKSDNIVYRYLAARALLHTHDFHRIFECTQNKNSKIAIISLCALHAQGIPIKVSPLLVHAIENENNITLQTLLAQNVKKLNTKQLKIWMTSNNKKLKLSAAGNIFNQENISENLKIEAKNILLQNMDSKDIVLSRYAHYYFWKSLYSIEHGSKSIYLKGLDHNDEGINIIVLRLCRIFDKNPLASYTQKYLSNNEIGKRSLNLAYALGCLDSSLVQNIVDNPEKSLLLRILSRHIMIYTFTYFQEHYIITLVNYLYKNSQNIATYEDENMRAIHYAYLATTFSYRITYDFTQFFQNESKLVQRNIMYSLRSASVKRKTLIKQLNHSSKIKWVKKYLDNSSPEIKHHAWAAWVIMSRPERTLIFRKAFNSVDQIVRKAAASGFYNVFYFYIRRDMPNFTERMNSLENFNELYYERIEKILPTLSISEKNMLEESLSRAIILNPNVARYYYDRALFFKAQKKYSSAKLDIEQAISLHKNNPRYLLSFAHFSPSKEPSDKRKVKSTLSKILMYTNNKITIHKTAQHYLKLGMHNKAKEIFWKLHLQNPTDVSQSIWLVKTYWITNQKEKAKEFLHALIETENEEVKHVNSYRVEKISQKITKPFLRRFLPDLPNIDSFVK
ncbi:protein kinase [Candidatus Uabimicrobium sp. HlEnr_7]|uniref:protein kinase domain-containing protein n=1 Tax=Candidatus Uabimicrobium helgolandensis TaxID=3095367 RepID=UPI003557B417